MEELIVSDATGVTSEALRVLLRNAYGESSSVDGESTTNVASTASSSAFSVTDGVPIHADPKAAESAMREALSSFFEDSIRCPSSLNDLLRHTQAGAGGRLPSVFVRLPPVAVTGVFDVRRERPTSELQIFPGVPPLANAASWLGEDEMSSNGSSAYRFDKRGSRHGDGIYLVPRHGVRAAMDASGANSPRRSNGGNSIHQDGATSHVVLNLSCCRNENMITSLSTMLLSHLVVIGSTEECYHALHRMTQCVIAGKAAASVVKPILSASGNSNASELTIILTTSQQDKELSSSLVSKRATVEASLKALGHGLAATVRIIDAKEDVEHQNRSSGSGAFLRVSSQGLREVLVVQQEVGRAILRSRPNNLRHDRPPLNAYHWFRLMEVVLMRSCSSSSAGDGGGIVAATLESLSASAVAWGTACYKSVIDSLSPHSNSSPSSPTEPSGGGAHGSRHKGTGVRQAASSAPLYASADEIHAVAKWLAVDLFRELSDALILPGNPLEALHANIQHEHAKFRTVVKEGVYQHAQPLLQACLSPLSMPLKLLCEGDAASTITSVSEWLGMVEQALGNFMAHSIHDGGTSALVGSPSRGGGASSPRHTSRWSEQAKRSAIYDMLVEWILPNTRVVGEIIAEKDGLLLHHKDSIIRQSNAAIAELETTLADLAAEKKRMALHEQEVKSKLEAAQKRINDAQGAAMQLFATMSKELAELHRKVLEDAFLAENGLTKAHDTDDLTSAESRSSRSSSSSSSASSPLLFSSSADDSAADRNGRNKKKKSSTMKRRGPVAAHMDSVGQAVESCRALLAILGAPQSLVESQDHAALLLLTHAPHSNGGGGAYSPRQPDFTATRMRVFSRGGGPSVSKVTTSDKRFKSSTGGADSVGIGTGSFANQSAVSSHPSANVSSEQLVVVREQTTSIRELRSKEQRRREEELAQRRKAAKAHNASLEQGPPAALQAVSLLHVTKKMDVQQQQHSSDYSNQQLLELREVHAATLRQLSELQREISTHKATERRLEGQISMLESHLRDSAMDGNMLSEKSRALYEELETLKLSCEKQGSMLDTESKKLSAAQTITQELRDTVTQHEVTIFTLTRKGEEMSSELGELRERAARLEVENTDLKMLLESATKEKVSAQSLAELTRVELDVDRSSLQQSRSDLKELEATLNKERAIMRDSCAKYERHIQELLEKFDASTERQRLQISTLEKANFDLVQQLHTKEESHSTEISALQRAKEQLVTDCHNVKTELAEMSRRCAAAEKSLRELANANKRLSTTVEHDEAALTIAKKELAFAREEFSKSQAELRHSEELRKRLQHSVEAFDTLITEQRQLSRMDQDTLDQHLIGSRPMSLPAATTLPAPSVATEELQRLTEQLRQQQKAEETRQVLRSYRSDQHHHHAVEVDSDSRNGDIGHDLRHHHHESSSRAGEENSILDEVPVPLSTLLSRSGGAEEEEEVDEGAAHHHVTRSHHVQHQRHQSRVVTATGGGDGNNYNSGYRTPLVVLDAASMQLSRQHAASSMGLTRRVPVPMPRIDHVHSTSSGVRPIEPHLHVIAQVEALMREGR